MKKVILPVILSLLMLRGIAQRDTSIVPVQKFHFGFGLGIGMSPQETSIMNASAEFQGEFKPMKGFSLYSSLAYHRLFSFNEEGSAGYATVIAGVRGYLSPKFFVGGGGGVAFIAGEGEFMVPFSYDPHIGYVAKKTQFILGYDGFILDKENLGFIQLKAVFRLN